MRFSPDSCYLRLQRPVFELPKSTLLPPCDSSHVSFNSCDSTCHTFLKRLSEDIEFAGFIYTLMHITYASVQDRCFIVPFSHLHAILRTMSICVARTSTFTRTAF